MPLEISNRAYGDRFNTLDTPDLPELTFPAADLSVKTAEVGTRHVYCESRSRYVRLTPEEWVRQHAISFLVNERNVPPGLISVEQEFRFQELSRRADIVVYQPDGAIWLLCECKAASVPLNWNTFEQVAQYNSVLQAEYILVTNGLEHYCYVIQNERIHFLDSIPHYPRRSASPNPEVVINYQKELEVAIAAVRDASRLCRTVQSQISPAMLEKKDKSPVTVADFGSQALVCHRLKQAFPNDPVIAEEDADELRTEENSLVRSRVVENVNALISLSESEVMDAIDHGGATEHSARFWTLDPIDGTKGFLRGEQYAVALALIVDGEVVLAALGCPNLKASAEAGSSGVIYTAVKGNGTFERPLVDNGTSMVTPVTTTDLDIASAARFCESVESGHSSHNDSATVAKNLGITAEPVRLDSQAKYAVVARGDADVYMRLPTRPGYVEKIWDHAAGMLVIEEAGGRVTDIYGTRLDFGQGKGLTKNKGVIATNGHLHDEIIEALAVAGVAVS